VFEADGEGGVAFCVYAIVVDVLLEQVDDGEEELLFAGVVQGRALVDVDDVDVDLGMGQQRL
jgi:hypothetical protein